MKFTVSLDGNPVVLSAEQVKQLSELLFGCEMIERKYLGSGKGVNGNDYVHILQPYEIRNQLKLSPLVDEEYDALKFITAAQQKK